MIKSTWILNPKRPWHDYFLLIIFYPDLPPWLLRVHRTLSIVEASWPLWLFRHRHPGRNGDIFLAHPDGQAFGLQLHLVDQIPYSAYKEWGLAYIRDCWFWIERGHNAAHQPSRTSPQFAVIWRKGSPPVQPDTTRRGTALPTFYRLVFSHQI